MSGIGEQKKTPVYKNAYLCTRPTRKWNGTVEYEGKCPGSNDEDGCPKWAKFTAKTNVTQEPFEVAACIDQILPTFLLQLNVATEKPIAETNDLRNELYSAITDMKETRAGMDQAIGAVASQIVSAITRAGLNQALLPHTENDARRLNNGNSNDVKRIIVD